MASQRCYTQVGGCTVESMSIFGHVCSIEWVGLIIFPRDYYKRYPRLLGGASEDIHRSSGTESSSNGSPG